MVSPDKPYPNPPLMRVDQKGQVVDEDTPMPRRRVVDVDAQATTAVDATTSPHRSSTTDRLPEGSVWDGVAPAPAREPTMMLDAVTTKVESAEAPAAPASADFDRVEWAAERLGSVAEALRADKRITAADVAAGARAGLAMGAVRGPMQYVTSKLMQRALLADAGVGAALDGAAIAAILFEIGSEILVGVEPVRLARRDLARTFELRIRELEVLQAKAESRGDTDAAAEYRGRLDELTVHTRQLRRTTR
jgi:hypothetical protein